MVQQAKTDTTPGRERREPELRLKSLPSLQQKEGRLVISIETQECPARPRNGSTQSRGPCY